MAKDEEKWGTRVMMLLGLLTIGVYICGAVPVDPVLLVLSVLGF